MSITRHKRLLVLFPGALGDFICFLPALRILSDGACVDLLARSEFADIAPPAVRVHSLERYEIRRLFAPGAGADDRARSFFAGYAAVYSWMGAQVDEFARQLGLLSGNAARIFPFRPRARQVHQRDYYLSCLGARDGNRSFPDIALRPQACAWRDRFWRLQALTGKAVLTLAPGSGGKEKNWPVEQYRAVAEWWRRATGGAAVVLIGPVEEERGGFEVFSDCCINARGLSLGQAAALLARSDVYLGNDSGITHLAAAVGARTVALFGPSDASQWAPLGRAVTVLSRHVACAPCADAVMKSCSHRDCLTAFSAAEAIGEIEKLPEVATLTRGGAGITV